MESQLCCAEHTSKRPHFQTVGQKQVYSQTIFYTEEDSQLYTAGTLVCVNSLSQSISKLTTVLAGDIGSSCVPSTGASISASARSSGRLLAAGASTCASARSSGTAVASARFWGNVVAAGESMCSSTRPMLFKLSEQGCASVSGGVRASRVERHGEVQRSRSSVWRASRSSVLSLRARLQVSASGVSKLQPERRASACGSPGCTAGGGMKSSELSRRAGLQVSAFSVSELQPERRASACGSQGCTSGGEMKFRSESLPASRSSSMSSLSLMELTVGVRERCACSHSRRRLLRRIASSSSGEYV